MTDEAESPPCYDYGLGAAGKGFTESMGRWIYDEERRILTFHEGLINILDEGWRETICDAYGGVVEVENPKFLGFSPYSQEPRWDIRGCKVIPMPPRKTARQVLREVARELKRDGTAYIKAYIERMIKSIKMLRSRA